ncbi:Global transcription regulator sge1 [Elasticomyces elasticus]|uniref:Global transcription regulator sge1 n=1 Tax=Exophiala sideris TaxID=1016849 RepID=A0ABR0IUZ9_9EURO|nr:Global transcription regulator sge1 [Elasticomyces elasticus]KAK5020838.1 Global transcription regulator sge1 [Exophiala sideris]KAK5030183.1 Global transcription regulator sge1 [Exophiala sideris]KAK5049160.1 Global transcription regulator sge1 [Exophiala sideris]KAK5176413.1 Global transcription regulator sge1 [Eurotiomycetes sp. CCFEE 6388]
MQSELDLQPSYFGFIDTHEDALMLIQACIRGSLHVVRRRPTSLQRPSAAQSGYVFIYEEKASGIQRWTDGRHWSPSRGFGGFLIYGERSASPNHLHNTMGRDKQPLLVQHGAEDQHQRLFGPLAKSWHFDLESLFKKAITVKSSDDSGTIWHLVSYYRPIDVLRGRLQTPKLNQDCILQPWHLPRNAIPYVDSYNGHRAGENGMSPRLRVCDSPQPTIHHVQPSWPMMKESERGNANFHQDAISEVGISDDGAMTSSIDGSLDPSLFRYGVPNADDSFIW